MDTEQIELNKIVSFDAITGLITERPMNTEELTAHTGAWQLYGYKA